MSAENIAKLKQQILAQGTTSQWSGEGHGSADANAEDIAKILDSTGITDIKQFGQVQKTIPAQEQQVETGDGFTTVLVPEHTVTTFGNKITGQEVPNTYSERQTGNFFGGTFAGKGNTGYGVQFDAQGNPIFYTQGASSKDTSLLPLLQIGLMATGAGGMLGNALLGAGASPLAAGALGGGLIGGGTAALTGGNILKGAALGAAGGAAASYFNPATGQVTTTPTSADSIQLPSSSSYDLGVDYSLANGTQMTPLTDMGGAGGLQPGTSANLDAMGGAQGITLNLGAPSTTLANALSTFGGMNPANLDTMGGAQGLTYQTPSGLVTQGGTILTGGSTGNNNVIGQTGVNTATNIGGDLGKTLAGIDTGVYDASKGALTTNVANNTVATTAGLTASQIANLAKAGLSVAGLLGGTKALTGGAGGGGGTGGVGALPTQGVPLNSQDYFNAIQQNYNALLPAMPRDVASPLAAWYNSSYGGGTTPTTQVNITPQPMPAVQSAPAAQPMPAVMPQPIASAGGLMSSPISPVADIMPTKPVAVEPTIQTSQAPVTLSPAQKAYADYLATQQGQGSASDISSYVKGLNDYQSLMSLANMQGKVGSGDIYNGPDGFRTMKELSALYGVPITNYGQ